MSSPKILYAIQGTGNGHLSRSLHFIQALKEVAEVDILISGSENELRLPYPIKFQLHGLGFHFGYNGGIHWIKTLSALRLRTFLQEVKNLPVDNYDLVVSDFEPVSAWACQANQKKCIGLSNQAGLVLSKKLLKKSDNLVGKLLLSQYAPCTKLMGLAFRPTKKRHYYPPIKSALQGVNPSTKGNYLVYLPSYKDEKLIRYFSALDASFTIFSKRAKEVRVSDNVRIEPINNSTFNTALIHAKGIISAAGFGTCSEGCFLQKKMLLIPQKHQFEQELNAKLLKKMGATVLPNLKKKHLPRVQDWLVSGTAINCEPWDDPTPSIVAALLQEAQ